jgi:4-hydroxy-tetrahydrodipicolinate synthase
MILQGVFTALITPFNEDGSVDWKTFEKLVERQVQANVAGVVPVGTTGESPTLSDEEKQKLISETVRIVNKRCIVIAGTGTNSTADTIQYTENAKKAGADACLIVNPYYNKPSQAGLIAHIKAVAAVGLPVILYNIPGRAAVGMTVSTIVE